jgi:hypothetical protein
MQYNVFDSKHRSNVQGNEENSVNIATVKRLLLNSETNTETETNFRILTIYFFFGIKNVRVGGKILGSIGNTHFFFWALPLYKQVHLVAISHITPLPIP